MQGYVSRPARLTVGATPEERTRLFKISPAIKSAHDAVVTAGQTRIRDSDWDDCDHFIAFVEHEGRLYEMDGNTPRKGPLDRGPCTDVLKVSSS